MGEHGGFTPLDFSSWVTESLSPGTAGVTEGDVLIAGRETTSRLNLKSKQYALTEKNMTLTMSSL